MNQSREAIRACFRVFLTLVTACAGMQVCAKNAAQIDGSVPSAQVVPGQESPGKTRLQYEPEGGLTLGLALELALLHSPELAASSNGVMAADNNALQAGAFSNPEFEVEVEEFGGSGAREGTDAAETSLRIKQSLELGGKRGKRKSVAQSEARLAGWDHEAKRLDVIRSTKEAFVEVLLAQGQLALAESLLVVAEDVSKAAAERVRSGKVPMLEETKAGIEVAAARMARDRVKRRLETARKRMAVSWGGIDPVFTEALGVWDVVGDVPSIESLSERQEGIPEVVRLKEDVIRARSELVLAKAERIPDVDVSAGISRYEEDGSSAFAVGFSVPLPLFDRNTGGIAAAKYQAARAEEEQRGSRLRATIELVEAHGRLESARAEALTIKADLLPGVRQAFDSAQAGYREGKYGYLEVLGAQQTLNEAETHYLEVLADYHKAAAEVERLTGMPIETIQQTNEQGAK